MKQTFKINSLKTAAASLAVAGLLILSSCSQDDNSEKVAPDRHFQEQNITDKDVQKRLLELKGMLPTVSVYNSKMDQVISLDLNNPKSFSFSSPGGGATFSSPGGSISFVPSGGGSFTVYSTPASAGGGGGGGVVSAGNVSLDINYVFCFNSGTAEEGIDLFDLGPSGSGFGGAVGIAGNFESLMNEEIDVDADISDFFFGVAAFYAFDGTPSGSYPVIDFFEFEEEFDGDFNNRGLAYLLSFQQNNLGIFFSRSGTVNFGSSDVEFTGNYYGITDFNFFDFEGDDDEPNFVTVPGSGALFCGN